jgi:tryptophan synthase beta chain
MYGVEPSGRSLDELGEQAATLTLGEPGIIHGFKSYMLKDKNGEPAEVYSIASGLDYPGVGPQHSYLKDTNRVNYVTISDDEAIDAFFEISRLEGIIPAIESSHALAYAFKLAQDKPEDDILVNLSGRGDKDIDFVTQNYGSKYGI